MVVAAVGRQRAVGGQLGGPLVREAPRPQWRVGNMPLRGQTHSFERRGAKVALCWQCNGRLGRGRQKLGGGSLVAWRRACRSLVTHSSLAPGWGGQSLRGHCRRVWKGFQMREHAPFEQGARRGDAVLRRNGQTAVGAGDRFELQGIDMPAQVDMHRGYRLDPGAL